MTHSNLSETTIRKRQSDGVKQKMFQCGFIKVVEGSQHVDVTERQSVGIFLTFSHHRLQSDSWDKTPCLSSPNCWHVQPWANVNQTRQPFVLSFKCICILNISRPLALYVYNLLFVLWFICYCLSWSYIFSEFFSFTFIKKNDTITPIFASMVPIF